MLAHVRDILDYPLHFLHGSEISERYSLPVSSCEGNEPIVGLEYCAGHPHGSSIWADDNLLVGYLLGEGRHSCGYNICKKSGSYKPLFSQFFKDCVLKTTSEAFV